MKDSRSPKDNWRKTEISLKPFVSLSKNSDEREKEKIEKRKKLEWQMQSF